MDEIMPGVICVAPGGCGWWWQVHSSRAHRWARLEIRYLGPFWPADGISGGAPQWMTRAELEDQYADCIRHLAPCPVPAERAA